MNGTDPSASTARRAAGWSRALAVAGVIVLALVVYGGLARAASTGRHELRGGPPTSAAKPGWRVVSAGRDRRVVVGDVIALDGRVGAAWRGRPVRWRIVAAPGDARGRMTARLSSATALDARFRPRVLGQYTLRLTVGRGAQAVSGTVTLAAVSPTPMVPIDTHAGDAAHPAIRIGSTTYHPTSGSGSGVMFVLVLDRQTLSKVDAHTFVLGQNNVWRHDVSDFLDKFDDGDLVIVSTWPGHLQASTGGAKPLTRIGTELFDPPVQPNAYYSAIGVPGMKPGEADEEYQPASAPLASVGMRGYLSPDQHLDYGYIPSMRTIRHYGADNRCAPDETERHDRCPVSSAGFWVETFDPHTLKPIASYNPHYFSLHGDCCQQSSAEDMVRILDSVPRGDLVTVESMTSRSHNGAYLSPIGHGIDRATTRKLALAIANVGGTRNAFNRAGSMVPAASSAGAVYTLVGWGGAGEGKGAESAADVNGVGDTARLDLVLRPDHHSLLRPAEVTTNGDRPSALPALVLDRGNDKWPLADDPGAMRAFAYLGSTDEQLGSDPRSAYWIQNLDQSATNALIDKLEHVAYPSGSDFTKEQFEAARAELITELGWVGRVRAYLTEVSSPFADNALSSWVTAQTVADKVYESVKPPDDETATSWIEFVKTILHLADPFTEGASGHVADLLDFGVWAYGATQSGAPTSGEFRFKANELGARLVERAQEANATYDRVGDAIVSDYASLRELGTHAGCNPSDPKCPPQWAFTKQDRVQASVDVYRATEALAYQKLTPLGYRVYAMLPALLTKPPIYQEQYKCGGEHPFSNVPTKASATLLQTLDTSTRYDPMGINGYQVYALGRPLRIYVDPPPAEIVDRMFDPVSHSGDPNAGGLGISQAQFMAEAKHTTFYQSPVANCWWQP